MFPFIEYFVLRFAIWGGLLLALLVLAVGPRRLVHGLGRVWNTIWRKRLDPEEILTQVVHKHAQHVGAVKAAIHKAEVAEAAIRGNLLQSEQRAAELEEEVKRMGASNDELALRAALSKLNLERSAIGNFREQLTSHCNLIAESRQRLYELELQARQYEVGRTILLSQLEQAKTVEEQYAIASRFDPYNAVANWQRAEGLVQEKALNARAIERVHSDTAELSGSAANDPALLEGQLAALRAQLLGDPSAKIAGEAANKSSLPPAPPVNGKESKQADKEKSS